MSQFVRHIPARTISSQLVFLLHFWIIRSFSFLFLLKIEVLFRRLHRCRLNEFQNLKIAEKDFAKVFILVKGVPPSFPQNLDGGRKPTREKESQVIGFHAIKTEAILCKFKWPVLPRDNCRTNRSKKKIPIHYSWEPSLNETWATWIIHSYLAAAASAFETSSPKTRRRNVKQLFWRRWFSPWHWNPCHARCLASNCTSSTRCL